MVELLADLGHLVARRRFRNSDRDSAAFTLERAGVATQMEPAASDRSFSPFIIARCFGRNGVRRMVADLGRQLSDLVSLWSNRDLDCVPIHTARNCDWHFCSFGHRDLGNAPRLRSIYFANREPIAPDAASLDRGV